LSPGKEAYIDFRKIALLPLDVLDLVSFRLDGNAAIDLRAAPPTAALASMQKRFETLAKIFKAVREDVAAAEELMAMEARTAGEKLSTINPTRSQKAVAKTPRETEASDFVDWFGLLTRATPGSRSRQRGGATNSGSDYVVSAGYSRLMPPRR